jgi:hypothetical protein
LWFATTPLQKTTNQNITHIKTPWGGVGGDGGDDILFVVNNGNLWFATTPLQKTTNQNITHIKTPWR